MNKGEKRNKKSSVLIKITLAHDVNIHAERISGMEAATIMEQLGIPAPGDKKLG